jgi:1-acyl-sn-glycerol-3-phosphate acyltransferase
VPAGDAVSTPILYRLSWWAFEILFRLLRVRRRVEGREHEPAPPYLIVANHASEADIPLVGLSLRARVSFMAKEELRRLPPVAWWVRGCGSFFVRRGTADREAVREALRMLRRGWAVCLFAEGTRSRDGRLGPFEEGAAYLALKAAVPVLPVGIVGSHRVRVSGWRLPSRADVAVRLGPPLRPRVEGTVSREAVAEWTARLREAVRVLLPPDQQPSQS